jgi:hypothetical protein
MEKGWLKYFIIGTFVSLYLVVSVISTIHVIQFFDLTNPKWLSVSLAIAFELGAAASLASLIALDKMNKFLVWVLFITLTAMQAMGNTYYAYTNIQDFQGWSELFGLMEEDIIFQKRILSIISGAILPLVALGFIKSLVDYIKPESPDPIINKEPSTEEDNNSHLDDLKIEIPNDKSDIHPENNVDVISISEMKEDDASPQIGEPSDLPDLQYVNLINDQTEADNQITQHASQEIINANYNRNPPKKGVPPFL